MTSKLSLSIPPIPLASRKSKISNSDYSPPVQPIDSYFLKLPVKPIDNEFLSVSVPIKDFGSSVSANSAVPDWTYKFRSNSFSYASSDENQITPPNSPFSSYSSSSDSEGNTSEFLLSSSSTFTSNSCATSERGHPAQQVGLFPKRFIFDPISIDLEKVNSIFNSLLNDKKFLDKIKDEGISIKQIKVLKSKIDNIIYSDYYTFNLIEILCKQEIIIHTIKLISEKPSLILTDKKIMDSEKEFLTFYYETGFLSFELANTLADSKFFIHEKVQDLIINKLDYKLKFCLQYIECLKKSFNGTESARDLENIQDIEIIHLMHQDDSVFQKTADKIYNENPSKLEEEYNDFKICKSVESLIHKI